MSAHDVAASHEARTQAEPPVAAPRPASPITPALLVTTLLLAAIVAATSLFGLLASWPYAAETANWRLQGQCQDLGNLIALGVLLVGMVAGRRGSLAGVQLWLGALLYLAYAFVIYAFALHFGRLFLPYVAALGLATYAALFGAARFRATRLDVPDPGRAARGVVTGIAVLFALLWLSAILPALVAGQAPAELAETGLVSNPVHVLDLALVLPGMAITARLAGRGTRVARLLVGPWLVFSALMGTSIVITLLLSAAPAAPLVVVGAVTVTGAAMAVDTLRQRLRKA